MNDHVYCSDASVLSCLIMDPLGESCIDISQDVFPQLPQPMIFLKSSFGLMLFISTNMTRVWLFHIYFLDLFFFLWGGGGSIGNYLAISLGRGKVYVQ